MTIFDFIFTLITNTTPLLKRFNKLCTQQCFVFICNKIISKLHSDDFGYAVLQSTMVLKDLYQIYKFIWEALQHLIHHIAIIKHHTFPTESNRQFISAPILPSSGLPQTNYILTWFMSDKGKPDDSKIRAKIYCLVESLNIFCWVSLFLINFQHILW